jgi:hypothetical protein
MMNNDNMMEHPISTMQKILSNERLDEIKHLNKQHITWRDYALMMLNSTADPLRSIWREKIVSSIISCEFKANALSEGNIAGLEILNSLPDWLTLQCCDEIWNFYEKVERIPGSKRISTYLRHYPQESLSHEAFLCISNLVLNWSYYGEKIIMETPLLKRMWDLSQWAKGDCLYPDEVLTYTLDKELNPKVDGGWIEASMDVFENGRPSHRWDKYWLSDRLDFYPFTGNKNDRIRKAYFLNVGKIILKEDMMGCPSWKRLCICMLKNDISMRYAGFSMTYRERLAREEAMEAFGTLEVKAKRMVKDYE